MTIKFRRKICNFGPERKAITIPKPLLPLLEDNKEFDIVLEPVKPEGQDEE